MTVAAFKPAGAANPAIDMLAGLQPVIDLTREYLRVREQESTARRRIDAWEHTQIEEIRTRASIVRESLDRVFGERAQTISGLLSSITTVVGTGDNDQLAVLLGTLQAVIQTDPLVNLAELSRRLSNPDEVWNI